MQLRDYQTATVQAIYAYLRRSQGNPCAVLPTGAGKTPVLATICRDAVTKWGGRVLVLAHVKELLQQAVDKLQAICPDVDVGLYSAGLGSRQTDQSVIVAGIQSVYQRACELGPFNLVIVDEAHLLPPEGEGMYRQFLADAEVVNPKVRVIGLTATPFRMKTGMLCGPGEILTEICYEVGVRELIVRGYLCPIISRGSREALDVSGLHIRAGEFIGSEVEALMGSEERVQSAVDEIVTYTDPGRNSVLIFAAGVAHAHRIAKTLARKTGCDAAVVTGETPADERAQILDGFKAGTLKYLVNVNVLTTGFDAPNVDCVAMVRPTLSPGLYYQCVGRGLRVHPSKEECLFLDFGGNVLRHGPIDAIRPVGTKREGTGEAPAKECTECHALVAAGYAVCPECGHEFPLPERRLHDSKATKAAVLSDQAELPEPDVLEVEVVEYHVHHKRGAPPDAPTTMRVEYYYDDPELGAFVTRKVCEWVCLNHAGFARAKAEEWWRLRSNVPVPDTVKDAVRIAKRALAPTTHVVLQRYPGKKWPKLIDVHLGAKPDISPDDLVEADTSFDFGGAGDFGMEHLTRDQSEDVPF